MGNDHALYSQIKQKKSKVDFSSKAKRSNVRNFLVAKNTVLNLVLRLVLNLVLTVTGVQAGVLNLVLTGVLNLVLFSWLPENHGHWIF